MAVPIQAGSMGPGVGTVYACSALREALVNGWLVCRLVGISNLEYPETSLAQSPVQHEVKQSLAVSPSTHGVRNALALYTCTLHLQEGGDLDRDGPPHRGRGVAPNKLPR